MNEKAEESELAAALEGDLSDRYGPVLTGEALIKALGYVSKPLSVNR